MNPDTKLILDELTKRFDDLESRLEVRVAEQDDKWERRFGDLSISQEARVATVERVAASLEEWRPEIDGVVDDIRLEVGKLTKHWETCGARTFSSSAADFHLGGRAPTCSEQCRQAQWAPHRQPSPGGWLWFGYRHNSSPGHGCVSSSHSSP